MNRLFVIAGLVILVIALVFLNQGINKFGQPDPDDAPPPPQAAAPSAKPAPATPVSATPSALPAEQTVGNPAAAKHHITVGWAYTDKSQQNPAALSAPIQQLQEYAQKSNGAVSLEIVNTDVPAADRSAPARAVTGNGVFVDGKQVVSGDLTAVPPQKLIGEVAAAAK